jgi:hypothetical protein
MTVVLVLVKNFLVEKGKNETVRCLDARASSFVSKVWDEVFANFHAVAVKHHNSMQN